MRGGTLDGFLADLRSARWWLGVVVVGILASVIASYLKSGLDQSASAAVRSLSAYSKKSRERRRQRVRQLASSPHDRILLGFDEQRWRTGALESLIWGISALYLASWQDRGAGRTFFLALGAFNAFSHVVSRLNADLAKQLLRDSERESQVESAPGAISR
jgi:hypothetical protein